MSDPEGVKNKSEQVVGEHDIEFDRDKGTLLLRISKNNIDFSKSREAAENRGLTEKAEVHLTVIGRKTAEMIITLLERLGSEEKQKKLSEIKELARRTIWKLSFKPEFYYIKKEYRDFDPSNPDQTIQETRESIIQVIDTENLKQFYERLKEIIGAEFEIPMSHVTLFTTSTREDKKKRGIGIYSDQDFRSLSPEKIEI